MSEKSVWRRYQDWREDREDEQLGVATQASYGRILGLVLGLVAFVAVLLFAYTVVKNDATDDGPGPEKVACTAPPPGPPCRQEP